jgi:hypothetical protein
LLKKPLPQPLPERVAGDATLESDQDSGTAEPVTTESQPDTDTGQDGDGGATENPGQDEPVAEAADEVNNSGADDEGAAVAEEQS